MTRIFDRYLTRQILVTTIAAVVVLTLVFGLGNIFKRLLPQLVDNTISIELFGMFILYILPFAVAYTLPWGFLSAVLLTFGKLSADSELISMRMAGISMFRICRPVFILAILLSGLCFWLNANISPRAKWEMKQIVSQLATEDLSIIFRQSGGIDNMVMIAEEATSDSADKIRFVAVDEDSRPDHWIFADKMVMLQPGKHTLLELQGMQAMHADGSPGIKSVRMPMTIPRKAKKTKKANEMTMREIRTRSTDMDLPNEATNEYRTELTKRHSISFACLAFCLVGIPLGVTAQRRETSIGFALSLAVAVVYFLFIFMGEIFGEDDSLVPHIMMWSPSVFFILFGGFLFYRMNKR